MAHDIEGMAANERAAEAVQLEALLLSRMYLYTLFHKLMGGEPTEELLDALAAPVTADVVDGYAADSVAMAGFGRFLRELAGRDRSNLLDAAKDEFTRIFFGPGNLPASPYESPYRASHDEALFQENTLAVRRAYHGRGLRLRREQAVPDDHVSALCAFMAECGVRALKAFRVGDFAAAASELRFEAAFARRHLAGWIGEYAAFVHDSRAGSAAVMYPQLLEALAAFGEADRTFIDEAAFWLETIEPFAPERVPELSRAESALSTLRALDLVGLKDTELVALPEVDAR